MNERLFESIRTVLGHQAVAILANIDAFQAHAQGLEKPGQGALSGDLHVVQAGAVGQQHASFGDALKDVGNAAPHSHGPAFLVQAVGPHHASFRHDDHHGIGLDCCQHLIPGVVVFAGDSNHIPGHHTKKEPHQRAASGLVGNGHESLERDAPDEFVGESSDEQGLVEAGVVEKGHQAQFSPGFGGRLVYPPDVEPIKEAAQAFDAPQHGVDALFSHSSLRCKNRCGS